MGKYLYGASVQGIQEFIFKTNKLREIVGASEMVKEICEEKFFEVSGGITKPENLILAAAGNIKCLFDEYEKNKLEEVVKLFPKMVMEYAPGITISQAVVKFDGKISEALQDLEMALKTQRNKAAMPLETGYMALNRARRTGGVLYKNIKIKKDVHEDVELSTKRKYDKFNDRDNKNLLFKDLAGEGNFDPEMLSNDMADINVGSNNKWVAVVHADGNGLGNIIQNIGDQLTDNNKFHEFSKAIDNSTKEALQYAFKEVIINDTRCFEESLKNGETPKKDYRYPIRPVVIGGDDVTIIIRADLALDFTKMFLKKFEEISKNNFEVFKLKELDNGLSACAGIAFVKESYPLHYALHLAEELCKDAKKMVKKEDVPKLGNDGSQMPRSSLAFFKVQDSYVESLEQMKKRTKYASASTIDYDYGPYLINKCESRENIPHIGELEAKLDVLKDQQTEKSKGVSKLRQLVSETFKSKDTSKFMYERMKTVNDKFIEALKLPENIFDERQKDQKGHTIPVKSILLDLIQIHSFK